MLPGETSIACHSYLSKQWKEEILLFEEFQTFRMKAARGFGCGEWKVSLLLFICIKSPESNESKNDAKHRTRHSRAGCVQRVSLAACGRLCEVRCVAHRLHSEIFKSGSLARKPVDCLLLPYAIEFVFSLFSVCLQFSVRLMWEVNFSMNTHNWRVKMRLNGENHHEWSWIA